MISNSVTGRWMEEEANYFAMCLLMPEKLVKEEMALINLDLDLADDTYIKELSKRFGVSQTAMMIRLVQLDILAP